MTRHATCFCLNLEFKRWVAEMEIQRIPKPEGAHKEPRPHLLNYEETVSHFRWEDTRGELTRDSPKRNANLAVLAVDRHANGPRANDTALHWIGIHAEERKISYADLSRDSNRFANALCRLGVGPGDRVFTLTGRIPALYVVALGTLKTRNLFSPLFSAFGPEPVQQRLEIGTARVLLTTPALYRRVIAPIRSSLPDLEYVLLVGHKESDTGERNRILEGTLRFEDLLEAESRDFETPMTDPEDPAILHFTSGTTGKPKGVVHVHDAAVSHYATAQFALDLHPGDVFWCTADPGWVTGTSYGIFAPLLHGVRSLVVEADFEGELWYRLLERHRVNIWYTSPTAIRMLMKMGSDLTAQFDFSALRLIASVGEPLNPEAVMWTLDHLGLPAHDNWWQTETGGIMIANYRGMEIRPGSMGRALPGIEAQIVQRREDGGLDMIDEPNHEGEIALRRGWPSMMRGYLGQEERYRACFHGDWYLTEDLAYQDEDGYFWFVGRADDMIKSAGHRIGPFEIESVLMEHPAVNEAAAIGKPHPTAGEIVKAFVELKHGYDPSPELERELLALGRKRLGAVSAPREIEITNQLPKTRSGKIMRRLLKAKESGAEVGDSSGLAGSPP